MPPKSRQTKLPRRQATNANKMDLETAAEERIDAITAEPLDSHKFVEIISPDKTLRLFYNTSTLIRIANDKGRFMQPPHFREPMHASLVARIEQIEGKQFRFDATNVIVPTMSLVDDDDGRQSQGGHTGSVVILHRHVYFDQIIDEFYHLNPAEVYVCPVCYGHYLETRYLPYLRESGATIHTLDSGETPVIDPLDVLCYMIGGAVDVEDSTTAAIDDAEWDSPLAHIVFRRGPAWRRHMQLHHAVSDTSAVDYRLRDQLCTFHNHYNRLQEELYQQRKKERRGAKPRLALTQQRYWQVNARYNCLRYNRIVEATERAEEHPESVEELAFPGETISTAHNAEVAYDDGSDFIVDDDETVSGGSDGEVPHYESPSDNSSSGSATSDGEDASDDSEEDLSPPVRKGRTSRNANAHGGRRQRHSSSESSSVSSSDSDDDEDDGVVVTGTTHRATTGGAPSLMGYGFRRVADRYYDRLSAEDREFVEQSSRKDYTPSRLYDPIMHVRRGKGEEAPSPYDDIDWDAIGEDFTPTRKRARGEGTPTAPSSSSPSILPDTRGHQREAGDGPLPVHPDEAALGGGTPSSKRFDDDITATSPATTQATEGAKKPNLSGGGGLLLLDDEE